MSEKNKNGNLKIVEAQTKNKQEQPEVAAKNYKITRSEIAGRVRNIRQQFEMIRDAYQGTLFDIACEGVGPPQSLYFGNIKLPDELTRLLNPEVDTLYQEFMNAPEHLGWDDTHRLYSYATETAFQIGVFFGVIMTDDSPAAIDKAEKGLAYATAAKSWLVKEE